MRLLVSLSLVVSVGLLASGCRQPYGSDPRSDGLEEDTESTEPPKKKPPKSDGGMQDAEVDERLQPRYGGWLGSSTMVPFGGKPKSACNYWVAMTSIVAEVDMSEEGEVTDMRVENTMVEGLADECTYEPLGALPYSFTMMGTMRVSDGNRVVLAQAADNSPKASLTVLLRHVDGHLDAMLEWVRTDLGPPYDWAVSASMALEPQVPKTKCNPGADHCGGVDVLGDPLTLYRCDSNGTTLSFLERCVNRCVEGGVGGRCQ